MKYNILIILFILIGNVNAGGKIPILYFYDNGYGTNTCDYNKNCLYNISDINIKQEENNSIKVIPIILTMIVIFSIFILISLLFIIKKFNKKTFKRIVMP